MDVDATDDDELEVCDQEGIEERVSTAGCR